MGDGGMGGFWGVCFGMGCYYMNMYFVYEVYVSQMSQ